MRKAWRYYDGKVRVLYAKADELHQRERRIKAKRGRILDRNGEILAANEVVCTVS